MEADSLTLLSLAPFMHFETTVFFAILAMIVSFIRYGTYFYSIYKKETRPHVFSWFNWGTVSGIGAYAQWHLEGGLSVWVLFFLSATCFMISALALFIGEKNITKGDWVTFIGALLAVPIWLVTQNPLLAIVIVLIIDVLTYYPTVRKSWYDPWGEPPVSYFWAGFRYFLILFTLPEFKIETMLYPFFLMMVDWAFALYVLLRRKRLMRQTV